VKDLTGRKFGKWTVLGPARKTSACLRWRCRCSCGALRDNDGSTLRRGRSSCCSKCSAVRIGTKKRSRWIGQKFGDLRVIAAVVERARTKLQCRCACGRTCVKSTLSVRRSGKCEECRLCRTAVGERFGHWRVISQQRVVGPARVMCQCDCGRRVSVLEYSLKTGRSKSCFQCGRRSNVQALRVAGVLVYAADLAAILGTHKSSAERRMKHFPARRVFSLVHGRG
jgi:hypothetical protein